LTAVGLLFVKGKKILDNAPRLAAVGRILPGLSSLLIAAIGLGILIRSLLKVF